MTPFTLIRFLLGGRDAILRIAGHRSALPIAILFVLSAGLAREYDGEDLLHEPWHILRPLLVSWITGSVLFLWMEVITKRVAGRSDRSMTRRYIVALTVFWMTAPLAWLYAVPYERMLDPLPAVTMNLLTLLLVSIWRVVLITRIMSVLYGVKFSRTLAPVLLFSDVVAMIAIGTIGAPVVSIMGGVRYEGVERLLLDVVGGVRGFGCFALPVLLYATFVSVQGMTPTPPRLASVQRSAGWLWFLAVAGVLVWMPVLFITQPSQILAHRVEKLVHAGLYTDAAAVLADHDRSAFPPHWEPPPHRGDYAMPHYLDGYDLVLVNMTRAVVAESAQRSWVKELYAGRLDVHLRVRLAGWHVRTWQEVADDLTGRGLEDSKMKKLIAPVDDLVLLRKYDSTLTAEEHVAIGELEAYARSLIVARDETTPESPVASPPTE